MPVAIGLESGRSPLRSRGLAGGWLERCPMSLRVTRAELAGWGRSGERV